MSQNPRLRRYWEEPVKKLVELVEPTLEDADRERHRLYALGLMSIVHHYWCGNKNGLSGTYPLNPTPDAKDGPWLGREYRGHNIAAIAVDADGDVIDFEFNHNELYDSSAEHAEARLVRRIFSLGHVSDGWNLEGSQPSDKYNGTHFSEVTIYTSLESCSQCAGVMALAQVRNVVYLQTDPGMYMIGNILRNLTKKSDTEEARYLQAPRPVSGREIELSYFEDLDKAFDDFTGPNHEGQFFYIPPHGEPKRTASITSFLCTAAARRVYGDARREFFAYVSGEKKLAFPNHRPKARGSDEVLEAKPNQEVVAHLHRFFGYATSAGKRGTPHH